MDKEKKLIESALKNGYSNLSVSLNPQTDLELNNVIDSVQSLFDSIEDKCEFIEIYSTKNK